MTTTQKAYRLPAKFTNDWAARCLEDDTPEQAAARWIKDGQRTVTVLLTDDEVADLLADARYYASDNSDGWFDESVRSLSQSAARVVKALEVQTNA